MSRALGFAACLLWLVPLVASSADVVYTPSKKGGVWHIDITPKDVPEKFQYWHPQMLSGVIDVNSVGDCFPVFEVISKEILDNLPRAPVVITGTLRCQGEVPYVLVSYDIQFLPVNNEGYQALSEFVAEHDGTVVGDHTMRFREGRGAVATTDYIFYFVDPDTGEEEQTYRISYDDYFEFLGPINERGRALNEILQDPDANRFVDHLRTKFSSYRANIAREILLISTHIRMRTRTKVIVDGGAMLLGFTSANYERDCTSSTNGFCH